MTNFQLVADIVNFDNKQVEVNSFDEHPTERGHEEILDHRCHGYACSLQDERSWQVC